MFSVFIRKANSRYDIPSKEGVMMSTSEERERVREGRKKGREGGREAVSGRERGRKGRREEITHYRNTCLWPYFDIYFNQLYDRVPK